MVFHIFQTSKTFRKSGPPQVMIIKLVSIQQGNLCVCVFCVCVQAMLANGTFGNILTNTVKYDEPLLVRTSEVVLVMLINWPKRVLL